MQSGNSSTIVLRIALPLLIVILLAVSPISHNLRQALQTAQSSDAASTSEAVVAALRVVIEWWPWQTGLWEQIGQKEALLENWQAAVTALEKAREFNALSKAGTETLGQAYLQLGDTQAALAAWDQLITSGDASGELFSQVFQVQESQDMMEDSLLTLQQWVQVEPENVKAFYRLGLLSALMAPGQADQYLQRAIDLDPSYQSRVDPIQKALQSTADVENQGYQKVILGRTLGNLDEWKLAKSAFEQAVNLQPGYAEAWAFLGEAKQQLGEDGWAELQKAMSLNPQSVLTQALMAVYYRRHNQPEKAMQALAKILNLEPGEGTWLIEMGYTLAQNGNINGALTYFQRAVDMDPQNASFWKELADFCVQNNLNVMEVGLPAARQYLILDPHSSVAMDTLGWVFMSLGDNISAERFILDAIDADSTNASAHLHLGQLYLMAYKNDEAYAQLALAVKLDDKDTGVKLLAQRLINRFFEGSQ
jgi:tetratricopeptide (TPR) repeat protein